MPADPDDLIQSYAAALGRVIIAAATVERAMATLCTDMFREQLTGEIVVGTLNFEKCYQLVRKLSHRYIDENDTREIQDLADGARELMSRRNRHAHASVLTTDDGRGLIRVPASPKDSLLKERDQTSEQELLELAEQLSKVYLDLLVCSAFVPNYRKKRLKR